MVHTFRQKNSWCARKPTLSFLSRYHPGAFEEGHSIRNFDGRPPWLKPRLLSISCSLHCRHSRISISSLCSWKTSSVTMASFKQFGDDYRHEPRTPSITLARLHAIESVVDPWELEAYVKESMKHRLNGVHRPFW